MSRIGNKIINVPAGVEVLISPTNFIEVKSAKGALSFQYNPSLKFVQEDNTIKVIRPNDEIFTRKIHGTSRALLSNMITGLTTGFKKDLEIVGVGYRANLDGKNLVLEVGHSHKDILPIPAGLKVEVPKNQEIHVYGADKQVLGEFCAKVRGFCPPEPYKGKGIKYAGEIIRRKAGKTGK